MTPDPMQAAPFATRRQVLRGGLGALLATLFAPGASGSGSAHDALLGFQAVPPSTQDRLVVPPGYTAQVLLAWGDPVGIPGAMPPWRPDASHGAQEQALQAGMHHDGMHYFPLPARAGQAARGLLAINHEYTDEGLLHADGMAAWSAGKVRKSQAAHGVSIVEVVQAGDGRWQLVRPSPHARRLTADTPMALSGPLSGHALMRTADDPRGRLVRGTLGNCGHGVTPWGTYLSCEENVAGYFHGSAQPDARQRRWGLSPGGYGMRWHEHDARFDATRHPQEFHRFGWVVEIDPANPASVPVKRTALGRAVHEGALTTRTRDGRVVVYMGEDARFECLYKFVSRARMQPGGAQANRHVLDDGTLYVARFDADGRGRWLPLRHGHGGLDAAAGFADQAHVLLYTREAARVLGATPLDRPEWVARDPRDGTLYLSLTSNTRRGREGLPGADAANPRAPNPMGHILRWREDGDADATAFAWELFAFGGEPSSAKPGAGLHGDAFANPDALAFDARGVLWICTDMPPDAMHQGAHAALGHNQLLAADVRRGELRRFLTGPAGCELTGVVLAPDGRSLFVNVQHPGETPSYRTDPKAVTAVSTWPDGGRPRSATVVVRRVDGGRVGT